MSCEHSALLQIAANEWVTGGHCAPLWDMLPLVTREHLTEEEHAHIINKMVAGSIAPRETIIEALDRNDYNHVTATYFLLAERKLRAQRHAMARKVNNNKSGRSKERSKAEAKAAAPPPTPASQADLSTLSITSSLATKRNFTRVRKISIVEEEEEEEDDVVTTEPKGMPAKGLSRHSSTSSLVDKPASSGVAADKIPVSPQLHLDLTLAFAAQKLEESGMGGPGGEATVPTPAPFPQSSQIGTGLSRQNSLRRSGESTSGTGSCSSPASERKSTPGSPGSPVGHASSSSPARFKLGHAGGHKKLKSPQVSVSGAQLLPVLNQIHEESEEGTSSPPASLHQPSHLGAPAGATVLRRLEQRRRLHKVRLMLPLLHLSQRIINYSNVSEHFWEFGIITPQIVALPP